MSDKDLLPFVCMHADPRCEDDPCPWGIARTLCNAPADHPARRTRTAIRKLAVGTDERSEEVNQNTQVIP